MHWKLGGNLPPLLLAVFAGDCEIILNRDGEAMKAGHTKAEKRIELWEGIRKGLEGGNEEAR